MIYPVYTDMRELREWLRSVEEFDGEYHFEYRDGKWGMFEPTDTSEFDDYMKLLAIKKTESEITIPVSQDDRGST